MEVPPVSEILRRAKERRFRVNSCFQLDDGTWRCNFREWSGSRNHVSPKRKVWYYNVAEAATMKRVLWRAYLTAKKEQAKRMSRSANYDP